MGSEKPSIDRRILLGGMVLIAFNFRTPVASVPPLLDVVRTDLRLSYAAASLLTTIPTLCFGVFAFAATSVSGRLGRERGVLVTAAVIALSLSLRLWADNVAVLFLTTLFSGISIAICQTLLPSIVNDHFVDRAALATGLYTTSVTAGAAVSSGLTAPLNNALHSWPLALASWGVLAIIAAIVWIPIARRLPAQESTSNADGRSRIPWRSRWAWVVTVFFGIQATFFYSLLTWLSPLYVSLGWSPARAGLLLTTFAAAQLGGTLVLAPLSDRRADRRPWLALSTITVGAGLTGVTFAPLSYPWLWSVLMGIGAGGLFALSMTLPVDYAPDPDAADRLTAMEVGIGYVIAAVGPFAIGSVRDVFGSYQPSLVALLGLSAILLGSTLLFDPDRTVEFGA